jgi:hypothetical protein
MDIFIISTSATLRSQAPSKASPTLSFCGLCAEQSFRLYACNEFIRMSPSKFVNYSRRISYIIELFKLKNNYEILLSIQFFMTFIIPFNLNPASTFWAKVRTIFFIFRLYLTVKLSNAIAE